MTSKKQQSRQVPRETPDTPNLDSVRSVPVGYISFRESHDGPGFDMRGSVTSLDQRDGDGRLNPSNRHTMTFLPDFKQFRIKRMLRDGNCDVFMVPAEVASYWKVLNE